MQITESLPIGTTLDSGERKYEVKSVLGQGGFGITYLVEATITVGNIPMKMPFAIKEHYISSMNERQGTTVSVSNENNTEEIKASIDSFLVEAQRLNRLSLDHSRLVRVNESFRANGTAYYVMEYIKGQSLREYVKRSAAKRLSEEDALRLFLPIAETVGYLHENKLTHLDIKPDNILIRESGEPVLIDFGLSKHYDKKGTPTSTIKATGCSAGYSPMEQYVGITTFTPEADIYALGATLLYMLTGKDPVISTEINVQIIIQNIPETVSGETTIAIVKAMQKLKEDRTHCVRNFCEGLVVNVQESEPSVKDDIPQHPIREDNQTKKMLVTAKNSSKKSCKLKIGIGMLSLLIVALGFLYYYTDQYRYTSSNYEVFYEGLAMVQGVNGKYGYIDKTGKVVIPCKWRYASRFCEGLARVWDENAKCGYIDKNGELIIPCQWIDAFDFYNGLARVRNDSTGKYGFIDKAGKLVIPYQWKDAKKFYEDITEVEDDDGKWHKINKQGKIVGW